MSKKEQAAARKAEKEQVDATVAQREWVARMMDRERAEKEKAEKEKAEKEKDKEKEREKGREKEKGKQAAAAAAAAAARKPSKRQQIISAVRAPPPKLIRLIWEPSDVYKRATIRQAWELQEQKKAEQRARRQQRAALDPQAGGFLREGEAE